jgi:hypothetical protein
MRRRVEGAHGMRRRGLPVLSSMSIFDSLRIDSQCLTAQMNSGSRTGRTEAIDEPRRDGFGGTFFGPRVLENDWLCIGLKSISYSAWPRIDPIWVSKYALAYILWNEILEYIVLEMKIHSSGCPRPAPSLGVS